MQSVPIASYSCIEPEVYVGSVLPSTNKEFLQTLGITHICSCIGQPATMFPEDFQYLILDFHDRPKTDLLSILQDALTFLDEGSKNDNKLYIYCGSGISRSPSLVIGHLIKNKGYSYEKAFEVVHTGRPLMKPNSGFIEQLKALSSDNPPPIMTKTNSLFFKPTFFDNFTPSPRSSPRHSDLETLLRKVSSGRITVPNNETVVTPKPKMTISVNQEKTTREPPLSPGNLLRACLQ